jgi:hypothetical protein
VVTHGVSAFAARCTIDVVGFFHCIHSDTVALEKKVEGQMAGMLEQMRESAAAAPVWDDQLLHLYRGEGDIIQEMRLLLAFFFGERGEPVPPPGAVLNRLNLYLPPTERW